MFSHACVQGVLTKDPPFPCWSITLVNIDSIAAENTQMAIPVLALKFRIRVGGLEFLGNATLMLVTHKVVILATDSHLQTILEQPWLLYGFYYLHDSPVV